MASPTCLRTVLLLRTEPYGRAAAHYGNCKAGQEAGRYVFTRQEARPGAFRLLMIPSIIEKLGYVVTVAVLHGQARIPAADATAAGPDLLLGVLFVAAFAKTPTSDRRGG
jgi:hypothetical protein